MANISKNRVPKRPASVPPDARWVPADNEWEQGTIDSKGLSQGPFTYWRPDGTKCNECVLRDGTPHGPFKRFHENGEVSQEGTFAAGVPEGTRRWFACDEPTTERMHEGGVAAAVRRSELDYERGRVVAVRHFDAEGLRVTPQGQPYPERPASVDERAEYRPDDEQWTIGEANGETASREGRWRVWSADGRLLEDAEYFEGEKHGAVREFAGDPNPFLDEKIAWESGRCEHGQRVERWEFLDEAGQVRSFIDYGVLSNLKPGHFEAWSNEAGADWEAKGRALLERNEARAALVMLARACAVARSTRPLTSVLAARTRSLKTDAAEAFAEQCEG
jgi:antitoxin component YwqK of YwqJK toxin-antitoxin module